MSWASVVACAVAGVLRSYVMLHGVGLWVGLGGPSLLQLVNICIRAGTQLELSTFILIWAGPKQAYQGR